jgi:hypothetical protein
MRFLDRGNKDDPISPIIIHNAIYIHTIKQKNYEEGYLGDALFIVFLIYQILIK